MKQEPSVDTASATEPVEPVMRARHVAAGLTVAYLILCYGYILLSSLLAAHWAQDLAHLQAYEQAKGLVFIVVTGLVFYMFSWRMLLRAEARERELLRSREALSRTERKALAGALACSIAHDLNNTLTVATASLDLMADGVPPDARSPEMRQLSRAMAEMGALASRLLDLGREGMPADFVTRDLAEVVRQAVAFARSHRVVKTCVIEVEAPDGVMLRVSARLVGQVILNLLINAAEATGNHGRIRVVVARGATGGGVLEVHDNGSGIPLEARDRLFTPFATTKPNGTGLGLLSVKVAAEQHGGGVSIGESPLGGALVRVTIA